MPEKSKFMLHSLLSVRSVQRDYQAIQAFIVDVYVCYVSSWQKKYFWQEFLKSILILRNFKKGRIERILYNCTWHIFKVN
jgi:hypothetical protein